MGRGRQKAKQTKVARNLKYFSPDTDYVALERELHGSHQSGRSETSENDSKIDDESETYAADDDGDDNYDDYEKWAAGDRR